MAGLYIHIPFCKSRCIYCNFYSTTHADMRQRYVDALCREMEMRCPLPSSAFGKELETIYLGGGTPSQLTIPQLQQLFLYINKVYLHSSLLTPHSSLPKREVTIEMNPDDVTAPYAKALSQLGINRVSMGAQTFDNERLHFLHRRHTSEQVAEAVSQLRAVGIQNISIDLMYGFPNETIEDWQRDIDAALALNVEHISAYCLMIEEGTPLWKWKKVNGEWAMDEELERQMYELLIDKLTAAGYEHYEISNFAKPGYRSRHNSSYWHDIPYIGLGAAAHSYMPVDSDDSLPAASTAGSTSRSWNVADIRQYIETIEQGERPCEEEIIDEDTHYNDRITTALRTSDGLDLTTLSDNHRRYCLREAQRYINDGQLKLADNRLSLTRKGLFVSDYVMSSLIMVD